jgi:hypothetical protein
MFKLRPSCVSFFCLWPLPLNCWAFYSFLFSALPVFSCRGRTAVHHMPTLRGDACIFCVGFQRTSLFKNEKLHKKCQCNCDALLFELTLSVELKGQRRAVDSKEKNFAGGVPLSVCLPGLFSTLRISVLLSSCPTTAFPFSPSFTHLYASSNASFFFFLISIILVAAVHFVVLNLTDVNPHWQQRKRRSGLEFAEPPNLFPSALLTRTCLLHTHTHTQKDTAIAKHERCRS